MMQSVHSYSAFGDGANLAGNMAGVCLLDAFLHNAQLQAIATKMGHSETAFLVPESPQHFALRWFTPVAEVPLCGHATLAAAAHVARTQGAPCELHFTTASGQLTAMCDSPQHVRMLLPAAHAAAFDDAHCAKLISQPVREAFRTSQSVIAVLEDARAVVDAIPNLDAIAMLDAEDFIITAPADTPFDVCCRVFSPQFGLNEDPVTGSAQCSLAPYWISRLGKPSLRVWQASAQGGELHATWHAGDVQISISGLACYQGETAVPLHTRMENAA